MFASCAKMSDKCREHKGKHSYLEEFDASRCTPLHGVVVVAIGHVIFLDPVLASAQRKRCKAAAYLMMQRQWACSFCASSKGRW